MTQSDHFSYATDDDKSTGGSFTASTGGSYTSLSSDASSSASSSWMVPRFGEPMLFPYHISGNSVAGGMHSHSGSTVYTSSEAHSMVSRRSGGTATTRRGEPWDLASMDEVREEEEEEDENDLSSSYRRESLVKRELTQFAQVENDNNTKGNALKMKSLALQIALYQRLGLSASLIGLHQKMVELAFQSGDLQTAKQSLDSILEIRQSNYSKTRNISNGQAVAEAHWALYNLWRHKLQDWRKAKTHYHAALAIWEEISQGDSKLKSSTFLKGRKKKVMS